MRDPGLERSDRCRGRRHRACPAHRHCPAIGFELGARFPPSACSPSKPRPASSRMRLRPDLYRETTVPATSTRSIARARRNTRCLPPCSSRAADAASAGAIVAASRRCNAARRRACRARRGRSAQSTRRRSSANISICSSASGAASCCPTPPIISPAFSTSARWRACATISPHSASSASRTISSRRITRRCCARSWRACRRPLPTRRTAPSAHLFEKHLAPWMGRFFADHRAARRSADFYRHVGALGRVFMEIEAEAFALPELTGARH